MLIENNLLQIYDSFHFFLASNQHRHLFHPFYMLKQKNLNHHTPTILHSFTVFYFLFSSECWWQTIRSSREIIPGGSSGKRRNSTGEKWHHPMIPWMYSKISISDWLKKLVWLFYVKLDKNSDNLVFVHIFIIIMSK